jgi:hypothetical protein
LIHKQNEKTALFPKYNFEKAVGHYQLAKQTHQRGTPYKEMIHQLFALEDDLNDEFTHFMLALDRMRYVNGEFEDEIKKIKVHLNRLIAHDNTTRKPKFSSTNDWLFDLNWLKSPKIKKVFDHQSKSENKLTKGGRVEITGYGLGIDVSDSSQGIYLISNDNSNHQKIEKGDLQTNTPEKLVFEIHTDLTIGACLLEVRVGIGKDNKNCQLIN